MSITTVLFSPSASPAKPAAQQTPSQPASQTAAPPQTTQTAAPAQTTQTAPTATPAQSASPSSQPTSQSVFVARSTVVAPSDTQPLPEASIDEDAARAAAEAYRTQAQQTAILETLSAQPDVAQIGLQKTEASDPAASGNAYSLARTETAGPAVVADRPPLDKVA